MDEKEKLVELLNEVQETGMNEIPAGFGCTIEYVSNEVVASHLIANGVTVQEWIPVAEGLPDLIHCNAGTAYSEAVNVLTSGRKVLTAIYNGACWIGPFGFWDADDEEITHWTPVHLPLPKVSKEVP